MCTRYNLIIHCISLVNAVAEITYIQLKPCLWLKLSFLYRFIHKSTSEIELEIRNYSAFRENSTKYTVSSTRKRKFNCACAKSLDFIGRENPTATLSTVWRPMRWNIIPAHAHLTVWFLVRTSRYMRIKYAIINVLQTRQRDVDRIRSNVSSVILV